MMLVFVQFGLITIAFDKLGLSQDAAFLLLVSSLAGSMLNLPLFSLRAKASTQDLAHWRFSGLLRPQLPFTGRTLIAVNVGGCLIPLAFSVYLMRHGGLAPGDVALATMLVSLVCYLASRPLPGLGIAMPILVAPLSAALVAMLVAPEARAPLAYVCGTLGVLIGADLLRLGDIRKLGSPLASIGGAGSFDGIFLTGIVAVLLA